MRRNVLMPFAMAVAVLFTPIIVQAAEIPDQSDELVYVITVIRHGDRTPFAQLVNDPHTWVDGPSQLTPLGMREQFQLGQQLRARYVQEIPLLTETYRYDSIFVLANTIDRTIQSAESLLYGLYPLGTGAKLSDGNYALPSGYQPIPIRTVADGSTLLMVPYPEYQKILKRYIFGSTEWINKENAYKEKFKQWQDILGNKVQSLNDVLSIGDTLIVRKAHNIPLPEGLSKQDEADIIDLCEWALAFQFRNQKVAKLMGDQLFTQIKQDLEAAATQKDATKFTLYSGHDITILPLMKLMGKPLMDPPPYAAHMQIELYRTSTGHTVRVRYQGEYIDLPVMINGCCSLEEFMAL